ncbi:transcriptional regulator [Bacillus pfraonensis]|uniref:transcriptional regulator n=1 Tax=Bacillus TaxID=1386 RepID=UPI0030131A03
MVIKIAVIGSHDFMQQLLPVAHRMEDIEIEPYIYALPKESPEIIQHLNPCDVIFFSGALPYYISKEIREQMPIPSVYLQQDEMAFATSLLSVLYHQNIRPERISIDLVDSSFVTNVFHDIGIKNTPHVMGYQDMFPKMIEINEIVTFHYSKYQSGLIDLALTSVHAVYDELIERGVPAERMLDPTKSMIQGLQDAKAKAQLAKSNSATVAVCFVSFSSEHHMPIEHLNMFARGIHGSFRQVDKTSYVLYTTRGDIEGFINTSSFQTLFNNSKDPIALGFGYGSTVREAEQHAKIAQGFAANHPIESCCYILTDEKELLGPFPKEKKVHSLKNDHPELLKIAKETKLSPANLSKIIQFSKSRSSLQFTAADLSDYLQVTRRTTERILKKLVDYGYANICGEEMPYQQGRPRAIYELKIPIYSFYPATKEQ